MKNKIIKSKEISLLTGCSKQYMIAQKHLLKEEQRYYTFGKAINIMCMYIEQKLSPKEITKKMQEFFRNQYKKEWFLLDWQYEQAITYDTHVMSRFLKWLEYGEECKAGMKWMIPHSIAIQGISFTTVEVTASLLFRTGNRINGYIIKRKFPKEYAYRARKQENMICSSTELQYLLYALIKEFPEQEIYVHMVRLIGRQDTSYELETFELKQGDNIITLNQEEYKKKKGNDILASIENDIKQESLKKCEECGYQQLCYSNRILVAACENNKKQKITGLKFSKEQEMVIHNYQGFMRVVAGPGSGKTATLVARVQYMILKKVNPSHILVITFTRKAAQELKWRIQTEGVYSSTIHSFALDILQSYAKRPVHVITEIDKIEILVEILKKQPIIQNVSYQGLFLKYGLIRSILKDFDFINRHGKEVFMENNKHRDWGHILEIKELYDHILQSGNRYSFDDLLELAVVFLEENPQILKQVHARFPYILVDEVQDVDEAQAALIQLISNKNLMIAGDSDQTIYEFRGGSNEFMLNFPKIYPEAKTVTLTDNYRSAASIVETAGQLISHNTNRISMKYKAHKQGLKGIHFPLFDRNNMGKLIEKIMQEGYQPGNIAIISRTNKELLEVLDVLNQKRLPVQKPKYFLKDDFVFLTILSLLNLYVSKMEDDVSFYWFLHHYRIDYTKNNWENTIYQNLLSEKQIFEVSDVWYQDKENCKTRLHSLMYHLHACFIAIETEPIETVLDKTAEILLSKKIESKATIEQLNDIIKERDIKKITQLHKYLKAISLYQDETRIDYDLQSHNMIHLLTAHDAKGLEFPVVIVYGIDVFERDGTEEERRILYVALTRAMERLYTIEIVPGKSELIKEFGNSMEWYHGGGI